MKILHWISTGKEENNGKVVGVSEVVIMEVLLSVLTKHCGGESITADGGLIKVTRAYDDAEIDRDVNRCDDCYK